MRESQIAVTNRARELAPVKTGTLRRSIGMEQPVVTATGVTGEVFAGGAGAPYARALEYGTGVHSEAPDSKRQPIVIVPVRAKALAWPQGWLGAPGGQYRRLSGNLRTGVLRKLQTGKFTPAQVFIFRKKVIQQGIRPRSFMRQAIEDSGGQILDFIRQGMARVTG